MIASDASEGQDEANPAAVAHTMTTVPTTETAVTDPPASSIADGSARQLDPRFIPLERLVGQITTASLSLVAAIAVVAVVVFASFSVATSALLVATWAIATAALAWHAHRWPERQYARASYTVGEDVIEIRRGVWWRHVTKVPRSRVQHTDVAQGPLERRYGLATLAIHSAGTAHARVELQGLARETALAIRDHLLPRESSDAV